MRRGISARVAVLLARIVRALTPLHDQDIALGEIPRGLLNRRDFSLPHLGRDTVSTCAQQAIDVLVFPRERPLMIAELALTAGKLGRVDQRTATDANFWHDVMQ
jgi:hypothetical protein